MRLALFIVSAFALVTLMAACYFALKLKERTGERDEARRFAHAALGSRSTSTSGAPPPGDSTSRPMRIIRDGAAGLAVAGIALVAWVRNQPGRASAAAGILAVTSATLFVIGGSLAHSPTGPNSAAPQQPNSQYLSSISESPAPSQHGAPYTRSNGSQAKTSTTTQGAALANYTPALPPTTTPLSPPSSTSPRPSTTATSPQTATSTESCLIELEARELLSACLG